MTHRLFWAAFAALCAGQALSQPLDDHQVCSTGGAGPKEGVPACTRIIDSGRLSGQDLANALINRGISYAEDEQYARALDDYDRAEKLAPSDALVYNNRGVSHRLTKQYDKAIADYNRAIALNPKYADAYYNRGRVYHLNLDQPAKAIEDYNRAIQFDSTRPAYFNLRGLAHIIAGNKDAAISDLRRALQMNPNDRSAREGLESLGAAP